MTTDAPPSTRRRWVLGACYTLGGGFIPPLVTLLNSASPLTHRTLIGSVLAGAAAGLLQLAGFLTDSRKAGTDTDHEA